MGLQWETQTRLWGLQWEERLWGLRWETKREAYIGSEGLQWET